MEQYSDQNQESSLFGFGIDHSSKTHLYDAAKWAKFLAIVGFVMCGLIAIFSFFVGTLFSSTRRYSDDAMDGLGVFVTILYLGVGVLGFFANLFLFRFATNMMTALNTSDQFSLDRSFQNLKITFRYVGIVTIVVLSLYVLLIVFAILGALAS